MAIVNAAVVALVGDDYKTLNEATAFTGVVSVTADSGTFSTIVFVGTAGTVIKTTTNNGTALPLILTPLEVASLGQGAVEVSVTTTDFVNTPANTPDGLEDFVIDSIAPSQTLDITAISVDSNITTDFVTSDTVLDVSGTLSAALLVGEKVQISNDAGATWSDATVAGLTWSYNDPTVWTDGIVTYLARIVDAAGNATTPVSKDVEIDTTASTVTLEITAVTDDTGQVIDDFVTSDTSLTVSGGLSSALAVGEKVQVSSDSGANWFDAITTGTTWSYVDPTVRTDGTFTYEARIIDLAGNTSVPVTKNVTIDATPPTQIIDIEAISDDSNITTDFITNDTSLTVYGSLDVALGVDEKAQISVDGGTTWVDVTMLMPTTWAYTDPTARMNGTFNYLARIVDLAGNVGPGTDTQSVTIDNSAPTSVLAITAISTDSNITTDFVTNDTMLTVSGTLSTPLNSGEKVQVSSDGGATWVDATNTPTTWSYVDPTVRTNGTFTYQARIIDLAGNTTTPVSQAVTVDNTNPAQTVDITAVVDDSNVPGDFVTNDTTLTIAGTLSSALGSGEKVQVSPDGGTTWFDATTSGLNWTYIDPTTRTTSLSYQARVIDLAGNVSAVDTQLVTIDTTAPTVTVTPVGDADKTLAEATSNAGVITVNGEAGTTSIITFTGTNGSLTKQIINTGTPIPVVLTNADVTTLGQGNVEVSTSTFDNVFNLTVTPDTNDGDFRIDTTAPVGVNDPANVVEAGGVANAIAGTPIATGNVLTNDTGLDNTIVREVSGNALNVGVSINGTYGSVVIGANGTYTYTLNNNLPATQALSQNQTVTDTFSYSIADVAGNTATANLVVTVTGANDAASIFGVVTETVIEAGGLANAVAGTPTATGALIADDVDDVDSPTTFTAVAVPTNSDNGYGTFTMTAAGVWTYTLNNTNPTVQALVPFQPLNDTFTVTSADGTPSLITIAISGRNDAPVISGDLAANVNEGGSYTLTASDLNFTDVDDNAADVIFNVSSLVNGEVRVNNDVATSFTGTQLAAGQVSFQHDASQTTTASFAVNVEDGNEDVSVPGNSTFNLAVNPVNQAPTLTGDLAAIVAEGGAYTITATDLGYNDVDDLPTGVNFNVSGLVNGVVKVNGVAATTFTPAQLTGGLVTFEHNGSETTSASFLVNVEDGNEDSSAPVNSTFNFAVTQTNDAPVLTGDLIAIVQTGGAYTLTASDIGYTDVDDVDAGVSFNVSDLVNGVIRVNGTPATTFTPTQLAAGQVTFLHNGSATTSASFKVNIEDGNEDSSTPVNSTFNFAVTPALPANVAPVLTGDLTATVAEGATYTITAADLGYTDTDDTATGVNFNVSGLVNGVVKVNGVAATTFTPAQLTGGLVTFEHNGSETTSASFMVNVEDGNEDNSVPVNSTFNFAVTPVNDAAVITGASAGSVVEAGGVANAVAGTPTATGTLTATDVDSPATFTAVTTATNSTNAYGTYTMTAAGVWTYTLNNANTTVQALSPTSAPLADSFTVTSADGTQQVINITITGANDAPVITGDLSAATTISGTYTLTSADLGFTDVDDIGTGVTFNVSNLFNGDVRVSGNPVTSFTPAQLAAGQVTFVQNGTVSTGASFSVNVEDGNEDGTAPVNSTFNFVVSPAPVANVAPVLTGDLTATVAEGATYTITAADLGYTDVDDTATGVNFNVSDLVNGVVKVNGVAATTFTPAQLTGGLVTFEHNGSETTSASFMVNVEDGNEDNSVPVNSTFNFTVTPVNDAPDAQNDTITGRVNRPITITPASLLANDTDAEGHTITGVSVQNVVNGTLDWNGTALVFTPTTNYIGPASFTYTISDGNGGNDTATVNINIAPNTVPDAVNDTITGVQNGWVAIAPSTLLSNDSDIDGDQISGVAIGNPVNGQVYFDGTNVVFIPNQGYTGPASFTYTITDGLLTDTATVTMNITAIQGTANGETLVGSNGNDVMIGLAGDDELSAGTGNDVLNGGAGNDTLNGGAGNDIFVWSAGDTVGAGIEVDTINAANIGDKLDFRDLLQGEGNTAASLDNYLHFNFVGGNTEILISAAGTFANNNNAGANVTGTVDQKVVIAGADLTANNGLSDLQIIQNLINSNSLILD